MIDCVNVFELLIKIILQERVHNVEIFFEMDILRKLIFMLMSIHKYNVFDIQNPQGIPQFDIQLYLSSLSLSYIDLMILLRLSMISFILLLLMQSSLSLLIVQNVRPQDLKTILLPFRLGTFANENEEQQEGYGLILLL